MNIMNDQPYNEVPVEKQPVPPLQQTIDRFLLSAKPFLNESEFTVTTSLAHEFAKPGGIGERLQAVLKERARTHDNWAEDYWINYAYLSYRGPLVINSNGGMMFNIPEITSTEQQLQCAATYVASALDYKRKLDEYKVPQEKYGPYHLDMSQYYNAFAVCRIPGETRDTVRRFRPGEYAKHIVVMHNHHFFAVPVFGESVERLNQAQLVQQLRAVMAQSPEPSPSPVGILTAEKRDTWYRLRQELLKESQNREALEMIETSIVVLSLDTEPSKEELAADTRNEAAALRMLHGGGSNSPNRWFDKALNLVVGWYGSMGVEVEHSPADGHAIANVFDYIGDRFGRDDIQPPVSKFDPPKKLTFIVNDEIQEAIKTAKVNLQKQIDDFDMRCYVFSPFGKEMIKSLKISPDGFIQMAIQLAFYRLHGKPSAQYESAILRRYLHGRTETIRSCSEEAVHFCRTMLNPAASYEDKAKALRTAVAIHRALVLEAVSGQGVDRHLMGLGMAAAELGLEMPKLFQDPGFTRSSYYRLSTSQMFMRFAAFFMFGPVVPDGYGICYNLQPDQIPFGISALKSSKTDAFRLAEALEKSFLDMKEALSHAQQASM